MNIPMYVTKILNSYSFDKKKAIEILVDNIEHRHSFALYRKIIHDLKDIELKKECAVMIDAIDGFIQHNMRPTRELALEMTQLVHDTINSNYKNKNTVAQILKSVCFMLVWPQGQSVMARNTIHLLGQAARVIRSCHRHIQSTDQYMEECLNFLVHQLSS